MIRLVKEVFVKSLDLDEEFARPVRFVPGTASYSSKTKVEDGGSLKEVVLELTIPSYGKVLKGNVVVFVHLDDDTVRRVGTKDLPARFEFEDSGQIRAICKWSAPDDVW